MSSAVVQLSGKIAIVTGNIEFFCKKAKKLKIFVLLKYISFYLLLIITKNLQ